MDEEPDIVYEPPPRVTELSGNEDQADAAMFAVACALLMRYTSKAYIAESAALFGTVADAFENRPQAMQRFGAQTLTEWTAALHEQRIAFARGLSLLDAGYTAAAYAEIASATADGLEPTDARDDRHLSLRQIAEEIGPSLEPVAESLGPMAARIGITLSARWAYQTLMADASARHDEPPEALAALVDAPTVATGQLIPKTGVWVPTTIRYGCPNFLIAGQPAPPMTRACTRYDYAASDGGGLEPPRPAWSEYEYAEKPTVWRMVWYDARYRPGAEPSDVKK